MTTIVPPARGADESESATICPQLGARNGELVLEHGLHQEIGWERQTDASSVAVVVFADDMRNPVIEAASRLAAGAGAPPHRTLCMTRSAACFTPPGPNYRTTGVMADVQRRCMAASAFISLMQTVMRWRCRSRSSRVACAGLRCSPSASRADLHAFAFGHAGGHRHTLARELSLATGRHGDAGGTVCRRMRLSPI